MKKSKLRLLLLFIGLVAIAGITLLSCKDDNDEDNNAVQVWECKTNNNTKLTLTMYPKEGKYYTVLSDTTQGTWSVRFIDKCWTYFYMADDTTMCITKEGNDSIGWFSYGDNPEKCLVYKPNYDKMNIYTKGGYTGFEQIYYEFKLKK